MGADAYSAPQEIFLFQIIAGKMGLNHMEVVGIFLSTATRRYFTGDRGAKVMHSFLKNHIDPKGRSERENRECLRSIYESVASHTERLQDEEASRELLRRNLEPHKAFSALWGFIYLRRTGQSSGTWVLVS